jgi:uncharacterized PurR-regulated membrane protein YhhQ (DUF165 family)
MMDVSDAPPPPVREKFQETGVERLMRQTTSFAAGLLRLSVLAAILTPVLLVSFLAADIPVYVFDRLFDPQALKPSHWLSVGALVLAAATPLAILVTRRYGGEEASRAITASWMIAAILVFAGLSRLSPKLNESDLPSVRFVVAYVASAMICQYVAAAVYDITRGGGAWWRAPLIAALIGFGVQAVIYFPAVYWKVSAPWFNWMVADFAVLAFGAFAFLPLYRLLMGMVKPLGGYGGR